MAQTEVFQVYLAGPISGCNEAQKSRWRDEVKRAYGDRMTFIDPVEQLLEPGASPYEFVEADLQAIKAADGLLVNMWRESIGTAIGVAHAHLRNRTIVVCDPNRLESSMLNFFADAVADTPLQGAKTLWSLLRAERRWHVNKHGGRTEHFERRKIMKAVRGACRSAACDDITVPRLVIPEVIDRLERTDRKINESLTTTDIDRVVVEVLRHLEDEPAYRDSASGVVDAWRGHAAADGDGALPPPSPGPRPLDPSIVRIPVSSGSKSHGTIWGASVRALADIPSSEARSVFRKIVSVPGVTRITLGPFGRKGERRDCRAWVGGSRTANVIEGKLYDRGPKGTLQSFQVHVQSDDAKPAVRRQIEDLLRDAGRWAG